MSVFEYTEPVKSSNAGAETILTSIRHPFFGAEYELKQIDKATSTALHQSTAASTWWCGPRPRLGWVEMAVGLPKGPSYPGHSPTSFAMLPPERPQEGSTQHLQIWSPVFTFSSLLPYSCPFLSPHSSSSLDER